MRTLSRNLQRPCRANTPWLLTLIVVAACTGEVGTADGSGAPGDGGGSGNGAEGGTDKGGPGGQGGNGIALADPRCQGGPKPVASPLRRLTAFEYDNTVRDLLGDRSQPARAFPEEGGSGFDNNADLSSVTRLLAEKYMLASEQLTSAVAADLPKLMGCDPAGAQADTCVRGFIKGFGQRAWRRPLLAAEETMLWDLYRVGRAEGVAVAAAFVVQRLLQSPHFLYRPEVNGAPMGDSASTLSPWETAARLSYFLWGTMPDDVLFAAAAAGTLSTRAEVAAQTQRMLKHAHARNIVRRFYAQWLGVSDIAEVGKDKTLYPDFTPQIAADLAEAFGVFIDELMWTGDAQVKSLLTAPHHFVNPGLAKFFKSPATGTGFVRDASAEARRSGVLTQPAFLARHAKADQTHPIARGLYLREKLLCQIPPPPPDNVNAILPPVAPGQSARDRLEQHRADPTCATCHELMDPLGLALENYDAVGRWRAADAGKTIDPSGELFGTDVNGDFAGPAELMARLADSADVKACLTRQWFRYAQGRQEADADLCSVDPLIELLQKTGNLQELLLALSTTDAFVYRTRLPEGSQL